MPFLPLLRPDVVIIWPLVASPTMSLAHTAYTSHMCLPGLKKGPKWAKTWGKSVKNHSKYGISTPIQARCGHDMASCGLSNHVPSTYSLCKPSVPPQAEKRAEKPYKFRCKWLESTILVPGQLSHVQVEREQICSLVSVQNFEKTLLLAQKLPKWGLVINFLTNYDFFKVRNIENC